MTQVLVIFGYGPAVANAILHRFLSDPSHSFKVALIARSGERIHKEAEEWKAKGKDVKAFPGDLSKPETIPALIDDIESTFGKINVAIYNATVLGLPYSASVAEISHGININIVSFHVAFNHLAAKWQQRNSGGKFISTGGAFGENGAWSVPYGAQFGAATKAYLKNFAQSASATFKEQNILVGNIIIGGLVYGGDTITNSDPNPEESNKFRKQVADAYFTQAIATAEGWESNISVLDPNFA